MAVKKEVAVNEQQTTTQVTPVTEVEDITVRAKAEAIAAAAEAQTKAKEALEAIKETAPTTSKPNGLVSIRLLKDNNKYKDDVLVVIDGRSFQIERGEIVRVSTYVTEVLEQGMAQDNAIVSLVECESSTYAVETKAHNI